MHLGSGGERVVIRPQHPVLDEAVESLLVGLGRHTRDEVLGPALEDPLKQGLALLVGVPALQVVDDGDVVEIVAALRLYLVPARVVE